MKCYLRNKNQLKMFLGLFYYSDKYLKPHEIKNYSIFFVLKWIDFLKYEITILQF